MPSREHHCCGHAHERGNLSEWTDRLQSAGHKLTKPRRAVLELLHHQKHPITNRDVHAELSAECDLASIYRTMHLLMEMSLVQQFDFGDGVARFELVSPEGDSHHHHMICTQCLTVVEVDHCFSDPLSETLAKHTGFKEITHKLEFFGLCPDCQ